MKIEILSKNLIIPNKISMREVFEVWLRDYDDWNKRVNNETVMERIFSCLKTEFKKKNELMRF